MINSDVNHTYQLALAKWGKKAPTMEYMEGSADLIKELSKNLKGEKNIDKIAEHIARVSVLVERIIHAYDCNNDVLKNKREVLIRLKSRAQE